MFLICSERCFRSLTPVTVHAVSVPSILKSKHGKQNTAFAKLHPVSQAVLSYQFREDLQSHIRVQHQSPLRLCDLLLITLYTHGCTPQTSRELYCEICRCQQHHRLPYKEQLEFNQEEINILSEWCTGNNQFLSPLQRSWLVIVKRRQRHTPLSTLVELGKSRSTVLGSSKLPSNRIQPCHHTSSAWFNKAQKMPLFQQKI